MMCLYVCGGEGAGWIVCVCVGGGGLIRWRLSTPASWVCHRTCVICFIYSFLYTRVHSNAFVILSACLSMCLHNMTCETGPNTSSLTRHNSNAFVILSACISMCLHNMTCETGPNTFSLTLHNSNLDSDLCLKSDMPLSQIVYNFASSIGEKIHKTKKITDF